MREMAILAAGVDYKTAPVRVRERLAVSGEGLAEALSALRRFVGHGVILSTCNRTEVYAAPEGREEGRLRQFLSDHWGVPQEELSPYLWIYEQEEAVRHLFGVASGLDSMVLGEEQILGQVRQAMKASQAQGSLGPVLSHLFRSALRVGKRARTETAIARSALSVSSIAVDLARRTLGDLRSTAVLVVSAGEAGALTAKALIQTGAAKVLVASRTYERAEELAGKLGGRAIPFGELPQAVADCDIVISATGSPHFILSPDSVRQAMQERPGRPLLLIDIAVPRDIDPEVRKLDNVFLYNIDDLKQVAEANLQGREKEVVKVEKVIDAEMAEFLSWMNSRAVVPTIAALRSKADSIRERELAKALSKLPGLSEKERATIEALTRAIMNKVLHDPMVRLKGRSHISSQVVRELFALEEEAD